MSTNRSNPFFTSSSQSPSTPSTTSPPPTPFFVKSHSPLMTSIPMDFQTSFFLAIKNNHAEVVEQLLASKSVDVDHKFAPDNKPAIFLAVESGHREIVARLVRYGCSVNPGNRRGETPLHQAVRDRRKDLIEILLKERAKINVLNSDRLNPLHLAVYLRCLDIVKVLIGLEDDSGPVDPDSISDTHLRLIFRSDYSGEISPFSLACSKGYDEIVSFFIGLLTKDTARQYFLRRSSNKDATNPFNYVLRLEESTVRALIDVLPVEEFLVSSRDDYMRWSPLHRLAQADYLLQAKSGRMAELLLTRARAPPDLRDLNGRTPLHLAIIRKNEPLIDALLRAACRMDVRDQYGNSPLYYAVLACSYSLDSSWIVERLLAFGVDLDGEHRWMAAMMEHNRRTYSPPNVLVGALIEWKRSSALISLQRLCRTSIRKYLRETADDSIAELDCVPEAMKRFLLVQNEPELLYGLSSESE